MKRVIFSVLAGLLLAVLAIPASGQATKKSSLPPELAVMAAKKECLSQCEATNRQCIVKAEKQSSQQAKRAATDGCIEQKKKCDKACETAKATPADPFQPPAVQLPATAQAPAQTVKKLVPTKPVLKKPTKVATAGNTCLEKCDAKNKTCIENCKKPTKKITTVKRPVKRPTLSQRQQLEKQLLAQQKIAKNLKAKLAKLKAADILRARKLAEEKRQKELAAKLPANVEKLTKTMNQLAKQWVPCPLPDKEGDMIPDAPAQPAPKPTK